jgi:hypothetical protein
MTLGLQLLDGRRVGRPRPVQSPASTLAALCVIPALSLHGCQGACGRVNSASARLGYHLTGTRR